MFNLLRPQKRKDSEGKENSCSAEGDAEITARHWDTWAGGVLLSSPGEVKGPVYVSRLEDRAIQVTVIELMRKVNAACCVGI